MIIKIYLSNLARYIEGQENGRWLQLPMDSEKLKSIYNDIVGKKQEHIILDYDALFNISEYENIFTLNEMLESISECGLDNDMLTALFKVNPDRDEVLEAIENGTFDIINVDEVSSGWNVSLDREEVFGMVLNEEGYNNLFSQSIPEEMIDYMDFSQIYTCLSINDGWQSVDVNGITYLVRF
uniref:Antirestriction protein ArdA n=1 Tax=Eubacterium plexicaudatum ASF492 TaxID=1235802 RepID=N1ZWI3_9FIRM